MSPTMRVPPHSLEQERALIACVLLDSATYSLVEGVVQSEDFYSEAHTEIWRACGLLAAARQPIDTVTLRSQLDAWGRLAHVGGDEFLLSLTDSIPLVDHAEAYARKVAELASRRRLILVAHQIASQGYDGSIGSREYFEAAESAVLGAVREGASGTGLVHIAEPLRETFERMQRLAAGAGKDAVGLSTSITDLDRMTTGMHSGDLVIVAGRPGMGKSAFMSDLILSAGHHAQRSGELVAAFSLEMQSEMVASRLLAVDAEVDLRDMRAARLTADGMSNLVRSADRLYRMPIWVDQTPGLSISAVRSRARRLRARGKLALIVVDYVQLMGATKRGMSREETISESTRGLKELAKEMGCPVVALSQLNRECERRPDKRPQLSDLRESGSIEQDADHVWLLFRRGYYAAQAAKNKPDPRAPKSDIEPGVDDGVTEIIVAKQRNGPAGVVRCLFREASAHFVNLERDYDEYPRSFDDE